MVSSNDFSVFALFTAGLAALANAQGFSVANTANNNPPSGNAFSAPGSGSAQPVAGQAYTVTWAPTTQGTVTLYLCKGVSIENCVNEPVPFANQIPNSGTFSWTPATSLPPQAASDVESYGIQLVVDATGEYQYTTRFGLTNDAVSDPSSAVSTIVATSEIPTPTATVIATETGYVSLPVETPISTAVQTVVPTGSGGLSTIVIQPTGTPSVPSNLPSVTQSGPLTTFTGAASFPTAGVLAVGAALAAFAL